MAILAAGWWMRWGGAGERPRPSVVLLVVDTLRADHLGLYGYHRPTSPALDAAAAEGLVFERAFATSPWTLPSFGSILTGRLPSHHGAVNVLQGLDAGAATLAELLSARGYSTAALICNPLLEKRSGMARGFARYDNYPCTNDHILRADQTVDAALAWIAQQQGRPFLLLVHFFDPHMSYDPPPAVAGRFTAPYDVPLSLPYKRLDRGLRFGEHRLSATEQAFITAAYDEEIVFVDRQIGRFLEALGARSRSEETLVILTSDHGEELFDHGGFEHGHTLYQEQLHVPLIVWGPSVRSGRSSTPVSLIDVFPTVLDAAGVSVAGEIDGSSLWPHLTSGAPLAERPLFGEYPLYGPPSVAVIRWPFKAIFELPSYAARLFDLAGDPGEKVDRAAAGMPAVSELRARAKEIAEAAPRESAPAQPTLDAKTRERLRALGYLE